jgi:hypothetical protein
MENVTDSKMGKETKWVCSKKKAENKFFDLNQA